MLTINHKIMSSAQRHDERRQRIDRPRRFRIVQCASRRCRITLSLKRVWRDRRGGAEIIAMGRCPWMPWDGRVVIIWNLIVQGLEFGVETKKGQDTLQSVQYLGRGVGVLFADELLFLHHLDTAVSYSANAHYFNTTDCCFFPLHELHPPFVLDESLHQGIARLHQSILRTASVRLLGYVD